MNARFLQFFLILIALLVSISAHSAANDLVLERAYFEDASNGMKLSDVKQVSLTPYQGLLSKGYSKSTFWVRLKIAAAPNDAAKGDRLIMRIEPTYLDEIEFFDPLEPTKAGRFAGDRHDWRKFEYKTMLFNFMLPAADTPRYVWLRLKTSSTSLMLVRVFSQQDERQLDNQYQAIAQMLFLSILMFVLWGLANWFNGRDRLIGVFTIKQFFGLFFVGSYIGLFRIFLSDSLSPPTLDYLNSAFVLLTTFTTIWFHYEFFGDYQLKVWWHRCFQLLLLIIPVCLSLILSGQLSTGLAFNMAAVMLLGPYMFLVTMFGIDWQASQKTPVLPRRVLIFFHALFAIVSSLTALPSLGFVSLTNLAPHFVMIHGFLTGIVMIVLLQHRSRLIYEGQRLKVSLAEQETEREKAQREEDRLFLEMLTHEIRTSLSVIRMSIGMGGFSDKQRLNVDNAIMGLSQVIERCQQVQEANDGRLELKSDHVDLNRLLQEVAQESSRAALIQIHASGHCLLDTDEKLLKVVMANLVDNALKYGRENEPITVDLQSSDHHITVTVSNAVGSVGVPDEAKVFQKYYRSSRAHGYIGSGLGLYLIKHLAQLLEADLTYMPEPALVKFRLLLPAQ